MKKGIHPEYVSSKVTCACGNSFDTRSTVPEIHVEICSNCHPFFTGTAKLIDTAGRVDKFRAKIEKAAKVKETRGKLTKSEKKAKRLEKDMEEIDQELEEKTVEK